VVAALTSLRDAAPLRSVGANGAEFIAPRTLDDFAAALLTRPDSRILAGSTDIGLWVNKMFRDLPRLVYIGAVDELKRIDERDGVLSIGARASLEDAWRALVARWPTLAEMWLRFAGVPLRHTGTMGGNVANGSPIGDSAPVLMALDASLVLRRGEATRRVRLADFYTGYMKNLLEPGEFVQAIEVPLASRATLRAYKISKRFDCDISAVCAGLAIELDADGTVAAARLAFGGMAATGQRAARAEAALVGQAWDEAAVDRRAGRAGRRLRPAHRHARERCLPPAGRAEPAQALLARDANERAARGERVERVERDGACRPRRAPRRRREPLARSAVAAPGGGSRRHRRRRFAAARVGAPARRRRRALRRRPARARRHAARSARPLAGRARPPRRHRSRAHRGDARRGRRCSVAADIPGRTTAGRSSTTIRSSPTASSTTSASRCSR
jgi:CO/xanthine dehydrogenase FAD-binding subunit